MNTCWISTLTNSFNPFYLMSEAWHACTSMLGHESTLQTNTMISSRNDSRSPQIPLAKSNTTLMSVQSLPIRQEKICLIFEKIQWMTVSCLHRLTLLINVISLERPKLEQIRKIHIPNSHHQFHQGMNQLASSANYHTCNTRAKDTSLVLGISH